MSSVVRSSADPLCSVRDRGPGDPAESGVAEGHHFSGGGTSSPAGTIGVPSLPDSSASAVEDFENRIARILANALLAERASESTRGAVVECTPEEGLPQ